jgi:hypothetical protein
MLQRKVLADVRFKKFAMPSINRGEIQILEYAKCDRVKPSDF